MGFMPISQTPQDRLHGQQFQHFCTVVVPLMPRVPILRNLNGNAVVLAMV